MAEYTEQAFDDLRKKYLVPVEAAARRLFKSPDGKKVLEALDEVFVRKSIFFDKGGRVDENMTLIHVGSAAVVNYLRDLSEPKEEDRS